MVLVHLGRKVAGQSNFRERVILGTQVTFKGVFPLTHFLQPGGGGDKPQQEPTQGRKLYSLCSHLCEQIPDRSQLEGRSGKGGREGRKEEEREGRRKQA